jgi:hypothetical protein
MAPHDTTMPNTSATAVAVTNSYPLDLYTKRPQPTHTPNGWIENDSPAGGNTNYRYRWHLGGGEPGSMIRKKPAPHLDSGVGTGFPSRQTRSVCTEIMLKRKNRAG